MTLALLIAIRPGIFSRNFLWPLLISSSKALLSTSKPFLKHYSSSEHCKWLNCKNEQDLKHFKIFRIENYAVNWWLPRIQYIMFLNPTTIRYWVEQIRFNCLGYAKHLYCYLSWHTHQSHLLVNKCARKWPTQKQSKQVFLEPMVH